MKNPDATTEPPPLPWIVGTAAYGLLIASAGGLGNGLAGYTTGTRFEGAVSVIVYCMLGAGLFARRRLAQVATSGFAVLGFLASLVIAPTFIPLALRQNPGYGSPRWIPGVESHRVQCLAAAGLVLLFGVLLLRLSIVLHRPGVDELFGKGRMFRLRRFSLKTLLLAVPLVAVCSLAFASRYGERRISETTTCPTAADGSPVIVKYGVSGQDVEELVYCVIAVGEPHGSVEMTVDMRRINDSVSLYSPERKWGTLLSESLMVFEYESGSGLAPVGGAVTLEELRAYLRRGSESGYGWSASALLEFARASRQTNTLVE